MWLGEEDAAVRITREAGGQQTLARCERPRTNAFGDVGRRGCEAFAERCGIQCRDREDTDAALMAPWMAGEVRA